jgi:hypothetical protein
VTHLGAHVVQYPGSQYDVWFGLYANSGGNPGALLVSAKAIISGNGAREVAVSATNIAAGTYFVGTTSNNFFKFGCNTSTGSYFAFDNGGTAYFNASAAPNPAPTTGTLGGTANFWIVGRE